MSLFKSQPIRTFDDENTASDFLRSNLGIDTERTYQTDIQKYIKDPATFITAKSNAEDTALTKLGNLVKSDMATLIGKGYPDHVAQKKALENAAKRWSIEKDIIDAQFPTGISFDNILQASIPGNLKSGMSTPKKL